MDVNQSVYQSVAHEYRWLELWPPERLILERFKSQWHHMRVLDLGVGAGRTAYTFAAIAKEYVGVDYAPAMIDRCVELCGESQNVHFYVCDARDLSRFGDGSFDLVLFCWNGIDAVSHEGRQQVLVEVRRVLHSEGHFFFSTHSVFEFPFRTEFPRIRMRAPLHSVYYWAKAATRAARLKWMYRKTDADAVRAGQYAVLSPPDHQYQLRAYYIKPEYQLRQLDDAGFETLLVYDQFGHEVDARTTEHPGYLYFLCRPARG